MGIELCVTKGEPASPFVDAKVTELLADSPDCLLVFIASPITDPAQLLFKCLVLTSYTFRDDMEMLLQAELPVQSYLSKFFAMVQAQHCQGSVFSK